jgi:phosphoserine phosphatase
VGVQLDAAFGNSIWDREMLMMARHAFAVNPNPDLGHIARERGWPVFWPEIQPHTAAAAEAAEENR